MICGDGHMVLRSLINMHLLLCPHFCSPISYDFEYFVFTRHRIGSDLSSANDAFKSSFHTLLRCCDGCA
uniref:Putative secreted protein n=1 Tax=Anopheles darlingi TaxID=43151 RepID=A0A2M4DMY4_ANODA